MEAGKLAAMIIGGVFVVIIAYQFLVHPDAATSEFTALGKVATAETGQLMQK